MTVNGVNVDFDKYQQVQRLINPPTAGGLIAFFAPPGARGTVGFEAGTGDYLVSFKVGDKVYKQILHVDRVPPGEVRF